MSWQILAGRLGSWSIVMVSWSTAIEKEQMETMKRFSKTTTSLLVAAWIKVPVEGSKWPLFPLLKGLCLRGLSLVFTVTSGDKVGCLNFRTLYFVNSYTYRSTKQANNQTGLVSVTHSCEIVYHWTVLLNSLQLSAYNLRFEIHT